MVTTLSFAQTKEDIYNDIKKGTETVYGDVKSIKPNITEPTKGIEKAYNEGKEGVQTVYGDVKSLAPELRALVAEIAKGLKTTSERVWDILVLQQRVWSWCYLFVTLSAMYLWWRFFKQYKITTTDLTETGEIKESNIMLSVLLFLLVVVDSTLSGMNFGRMMTGFCNPEYQVLTTLVDLALTLK